MKLYKWFSICSKHHDYRKDCNLCNTGHMVFMPAHHIGSFVYKVSPKMWRWYANIPRNKRKWLRSFKRYENKK